MYQAEVCNILSDFYINIAKEIGINNQTTDAAITTHPSIQAIKDNSPIEGFESFDFKPVSESQVLKIINSLSSKKATGVDQVPPKLWDQLRVQHQVKYLAAGRVYIDRCS